MKALAADSPCACGRMGAGKVPLSYGECCGRWLEDATQTAQPPDAESLMRSRYSAFVLERADWLRQTWAPGHAPADLAFDPGTRWLGLEVRAQRQTGEHAAEVEFVARQKPPQGPAVRLHERSRFVRTDGRWLYVDGDLL